MKTSLKLFVALLVAFAMTFSISGCFLEDIVGATEFNVIYSGNQNTAGDPPQDSNVYSSGDTVTVLDNTGSLEYTGYVFDGWNSQADGLGTDYAVGSNFAITANKLLYAKWVNENSLPRYAMLKQVKLKPVTVAPPNDMVVPVMHVEHFGDVKLDSFIMSFGEYGTEMPLYTFKEAFEFEMGTQIYEIEDVDFINMPMNTYTAFSVNNSANYFKRQISTTDTLSFRSSFFISNFAKPVHPNPATVTSVGSTGGSTVDIFEEINHPVANGVTELTVEFNDCELKACGFINYSVQFIFEITRGNIPQEVLYTVSYDGNGATENVPNDSINYYSGSVAVIKQQGSMANPNYQFLGWNTQQNGSGIAYNGNDTITMTANITLYAQWESLASALIKGKSIKDIELNGATYVSANSVALTGNYEYGMLAYLYVDHTQHPTLKISDFVTFEILPANAVVEYVFLNGFTPIGDNDAFAVPTTTNTQVGIQVKVMQGTAVLDQTMIYVRRLP